MNGIVLLKWDCKVITSEDEMFPFVVVSVLVWYELTKHLGSIIWQFME